MTMPTRARRVLFAALLLAVRPTSFAEATLRFGDLQISGDLSAQNLVRHRSPSDYQFIQQRNTARVRLDYEWLKRGKLLGKYETPWLRRSSLYLLYRGVYDSVFDWAPGGELMTNQGTLDGGQISDIPHDVRNALKYENTLREGYVDLDFSQVPLHLRIGRQQIVWGETDFFRMLDRVNALDLTWHLVWETEGQHGWDQLRIPYWMVKYLWDLPNLGPVTETFLEGYWNPGDWVPAKRRFEPYSVWSIPFQDPLQGIFPNGLERSTIFRQGDYSRNPADNSQVGVRVGGLVGGVQMTLNYFYQRWAGDDATPAAIFQADPDPASATAAIAAGIFPAQYIAPYVNTVGFSANYFDDFTGAVFKTETIYDFGVPFSNADDPSPVLPTTLFGVAKRDMWKGMIGVDRPTWIRPINRTATWLLLGQMFWHHIIDNPTFIPDVQKGFVGPSGPPLAPLAPNGKPLDEVRDWELLFSLAATSFYAGGTFVPQISYVLDPLNSFNMLVFWSFDYYVTNDLIVNLAQRYFINTTESPVYEPWGLAGFNRGRSETQLRLTWQF